MSDPVTTFEERRRFLTGLAYRILGSLSEAEDAVQDTFLKWREADHATIDNPAAWLTTVCTRHCIDLLRAAQKARVDYVGAWLPEPIHMMTDDTPDRALELSSSLSTAFLLLLERLTPRERAAYLLHEIFDLSYPEVAAALGIQEAACRKLVSRARTSVGKTKARHRAPPARQEELLAEFQHAAATGRTDAFAALLSDDIALTADGGGKVPAIPRPIQGKVRVLEIIAKALHRWWRTLEWRPADINGTRGVLLLEDGRIVAAVSFAYDDEDRIAGIYIMRNPDKLAHLSEIQTSLS